MTSISKAVLITGCSTGIGREEAAKLLPDAAFDGLVRTQFPSPEPSIKG